MEKKNIYYFSNDGTVRCYGHFFFAVLIPLIYYDIKTKSKYSYILKINIGNLFNILKYIFNERIENDYINNKTTINDKFELFDLYISLLKNKNNNDIVLKAYDIFISERFELLTKNYNHDEYKKLKDLFINYHFYKDKNDKPSNFNLIKDEFLKNKLRYKRLDITNKYIKLKKIRPYIIEFFESKIQKNILHSHSIVLIERKIPNTIIPANICDARGGERRFLLNHKEIKKKLHEIYKKKFINVVLEDCNIYEQYSIFINAKFIIGQHGSGLVNIFFSKNIKLIELGPKNNLFLCNFFKNLSTFCKFNYLRIKYNSMTEKELITLNNKYNLFSKNDIDNLSNDIKIYEKKKNKYDISSIIYFLLTSGSKIDINQIINAIKN